MTMRSELREIGRVTFPTFTGTRIMMMPFKWEDQFPLAGYAAFVANMVRLAELRPSRAYPEGFSIAYMTIDEAEIPEGETHRRPGLHVDGWGGADGRDGGWGGGGSWGANGFVVAASEPGCVAYPGEFDECPGNDGGCEPMRRQLPPPTILAPNVAYYMNPLCVHEGTRMPTRVRRQFARLSFPNDRYWYEGYTESPVGVKPWGKVKPRRSAQMEYRP